MESSFPHCFKFCASKRENIKGARSTTYLQSLQQKTKYQLIPSGCPVACLLQKKKQENRKLRIEKIGKIENLYSKIEETYENQQHFSRQRQPHCTPSAIPIHHFSPSTAVSINRTKRVFWIAFLFFLISLTEINLPTNLYKMTLFKKRRNQRWSHNFQDFLEGISVVTGYRFITLISLVFKWAGSWSSSSFCQYIAN